MDYGSLIYVTLQRARTAREAIRVMTSLVERYGYYSGGESFSIADPNEVWVLEMVSKGMDEKGAVWAAIRIPDDCISGHANQSRIHRIPFGDKQNCLYSKDVVKYARRKGWFKGKDEDFSFCQAYAVSDYLAYRGCDGRVWAYFNRFADGMDRYLPWVTEMKGDALPLYVKPTKKLSVRDLQKMMRDHFDGTPMDMRKEPGAGDWDSPVRYAPLTWTQDSVEYMHERPIATQQTGFTLVAQMRSWLPDAVGGVLWFGVDDSSLSVYNPMYCCLTQVPECFRQGNGDFYNFSWTSAFWVNNWVANQVYSRYSQMYPDVCAVQKRIEDSYEAAAPQIEARALEAYKENPAKAVEMLTAYSDSCAMSATDSYRKLATNLTTGNMVWFGKELLACDFDAMQTYTAEGEGAMINGASYYPLYAGRLLEIVNAAFNPYDAPIASGSLNVITPDQAYSYQKKPDPEPETSEDAEQSEESEDPGDMETPEEPQEPENPDSSEDPFPDGMVWEDPDTDQKGT